MSKNGFHKQHKIGIAAFVFFLMGALAMVLYLYLTDNTVYLMQKRDDYSESFSKQTADKKDSFDKHSRFVTYNNYNRKYANNFPQKVTSQQQSDSLHHSYGGKYYMDYKTDKADIVLDLNTCDTLDLQMLRGIGSSFARRIYRYREKLGGYVTVTQLQEVYGMTQELYTDIENHFVINNPAVRKLNINTCNLKDLASHPYIDVFLAKEIIVFRNNYGSFTDIDQLRSVHLITDSLFFKLRPYLSLQ